MGSKLFNDMVHGYIEFHPLIVSIIDTPQFQRLRHIKQMGSSYFVFPGAVHTRFEHSLGTCFLAGKLMEALNQKRNTFDADTRKETLCVQIAGLCHDLGHGPFSHTWEKFLNRCGVKWKHEEMSIEIFERILKETVPDREKIDGKGEVTITELFRRFGMEEYISKIKNIILGDESEDKSNLYLYQIIANKKNGVDVDKWDYLMRDSKMANVSINFDCYRMIHCCQVLETSPDRHEICFRDEECRVLIDMFLSRGFLHDKVYQHRKVKIIEEMLLDAFYLAKDRLNLTSAVLDDFLKLTDHIYLKILYDDFGNDDNMKQSKKILEKLSKRSLYICIASKQFEGKKLKKEILRKLEQKMYEKLQMDDSQLQRDLIGTVVVDVHMTKFNRRNLLEGVKVYPKQTRGGEESFPVPFDINKFSGLKPELKNMEKKEILVIYKGDDRSKYYNRKYDCLLTEIWEDISPQMI